MAGLNRINHLVSVAHANKPTNTRFTMKSIIVSILSLGTLNVLPK